MKTLSSHVEGRWHTARDGFATLVDPTTEEPIARASSAGVDFAATLEFAREHGGPALRRRTPAERGAWLMQLSRALQAGRDELIELSVRNTGTTKRDAKFDIDGAIYTLAHYAELGAAHGERRWFVDGAGLQLGRSRRFWGQHLCVPRNGVALHINAFNFPAWGLAEKAACALLAGMPVISKPATSTAWVAARCVELIVDADVLPPGALSLICGSTGDLLERLGAQDVLAFTGSADTALQLRGKPNLLECSTRVNIEADSLNAAVLGPDVEPGSETWAAFIRDVVREVSQKTGQKCTAVRRILVPAARVASVEQALAGALGEIVTGNPQDPSVRMGPLTTRRQLDDAIEGVRRLQSEASLVFGDGRRLDGAGCPPGRGFFLGPTLLRCADPAAAEVVHRHEVFGPVATLLPHDGSAGSAAALVARGGGSLVTSLYTDDRDYVGEFLAQAGASSGRLYLGSRKIADQLPGSGVAMPQLLHGGPGRAGGGAELGGERGLELYVQRVAVSGDRALIERLAGTRPA